VTHKRKKKGIAKKEKKIFLSRNVFCIFQSLLLFSSKKGIVFNTQTDLVDLIKLVISCFHSYLTMPTEILFIFLYRKGLSGNDDILFIAEMTS